MKKLFLLAFFIVTIFTARAQNTACKVLADSLKGTYDGDCKNGKAHGKGRATGADIYIGDFKNGLPEGTGKHTWKSGGFYEGQWKKGLKDGKGEMHTVENNEVMVKTGYWKKDRYVGLYENPFRIITATSDVGRVEVNNTGKNGRSITVTVNGLVDRSSVNSNSNAIVVMTDFQIVTGTYTTKSNNKLTNSDVTVFRDVVFPFMATFNFGASILQIELFESGDWDVYVPISK